MSPFQRHFQADGTFRWYECEHARCVDAGYYLLLDFLSAGGVPDDVPYVAPPLAPTYFPPITARQLRLWLIGAGVPLTAIDTRIAAIPDATQRAMAQVEWEYATQYERTHPLVEQIGAALGLTGTQIDAAFTAAAKL